MKTKETRKAHMKKLSFAIAVIMLAAALTIPIIVAQAVSPTAPESPNALSENETGISANTPQLSSALNIIRNNFELKKSSMLDTEITFTAEEFEKVLGVKQLKYVTITQLPSKDEGVLTLGGVEVLAGQTISRENIKYMRLVPYSGQSGAITFYFKNALDKSQDAAIPCTVNVIDTLNFAPVANPVNLSTQKNITAINSMKGTDPDKDSLKYRISRPPKHGILSIYDTSNGHFAYIPDANFTGSDSFVYQIEDEYGNLSNLATVDIKIKKAAANIIFDDLKNHWAHNSAVKAFSAGFISAGQNGEQNIFNPEQLVSRAEFIEMAVKAAKLDKNLEEIYSTGFADDVDIPLKYKSYVEKAYEMGIINGISTETGVYFDPNSPITRSEAAVIVNGIINVPVNTLSYSTSRGQFVDAVVIPDWAENDIAALNSCGIIKGDENGNMNPNGLMNRAQSVELLCGMIEYTDSQKKPFSFLSWIFK